MLFLRLVTKCFALFINIMHHTYTFGMFFRDFQVHINILLYTDHTSLKEGSCILASSQHRVYQKDKLFGKFTKKILQEYF